MYESKGKAKKPLCVVIPVHNRKEYTQNCLLSLNAQTDKDFDIIVIDDGSTDGTTEMIEKDFSHVTLLRGDGNLWWTKSINLGVLHALKRHARYIITVNDDTVLLNDFVEKMIYWSEKEPKALLGAFALNATNRQPYYGGERMKWYNAGSTKLLDILPKSEQHGLHRVTHFPGRGLFIPSEVFISIGQFDEKRFPQRIADIDFTIRAAKAGYDVYCNYDARLMMYPEASGDYTIRHKKTIRNYYHHLFSRKGGANLAEFISFALKDSPKSYLPMFMITGLSRRMLGYLRDWFLEIFKKMMQ